MSIIDDALKKAQGEKSPLNPQGDIRQENKVTATSRETTTPRRHIILFSLGIGALILIMFAASTLFKRQGKTSVLPSADEASQQTLSVDVVSPQVLREDSDISMGRTDLLEPEFMLTGIIHGTGSPMAVINDEVYTVGDIVGSAKIIEISEDAVILEKGGKRITLRVS